MAAEAAAAVATEQARAGQEAVPALKAARADPAETPAVVRTLVETASPQVRVQVVPAIRVEVETRGVTANRLEPVQVVPAMDGVAVTIVAAHDRTATTGPTPTEARPQVPIAATAVSVPVTMPNGQPNNRSTTGRPFPTT